MARAVRRGQLIRPDTCGRCGNGGETSDGRAFIHAHHHNGYDAPLDVEWLCPGCHFQEDPRPAGERQGRAKLTAAQVAEIRARYRPGGKWWRPEGSARALAREYGISDRTLGRIIRREIWIDAALKA